jgi:hypothetical protein
VFIEPPIIFADHCEAETTLVEITRRGPILLDWPVSNIGDTVNFQWDSCEDLTTLGGNVILRNASRSCGRGFPAGAGWEAVFFVTVTESGFDFTFTTRRLCDVASVSDILIVIRES